MSNEIATDQITSLIQHLLDMDDNSLLRDCVISTTSCESIAITHVPTKECWEIEITRLEPMV